MNANARKSANYKVGGGKSPIRKFYEDYRDEVIFGILLTMAVIVSYILSPLIPVHIFRAVIMPAMYVMIITFCFGSAWLFWQHHEGKRMRKMMAGIMLAWTILSLIGLGVKYGTGMPDVADGIFSLQGWEFVLGDILAWMLIAYPAEILRPGRVTFKLALQQLTPVIIIGFIDWWFDIDLRWLLVLYPLFILLLLVRDVRAYREWCEQNYASMDNIDVQWVVRYMIMVFITGCSFTYMCFSNEPTYSFTQLWLLFFLLFYSTEKIFLRPDPWKEYGRTKDEDGRTKEEAGGTKAPAPAGGADDGSAPAPDNSTYAATLEQWMETEKPYLNKDFRLTDLMRVLPMNRTYLSQFIMQQYDCNFYQLVAHYRIEEAKRLMREYPDLKFQEIAERSGFASPVVFTRTFVRETGVTPSEWSKGIDNS